MQIEGQFQRIRPRGIDGGYDSSRNRTVVTLLVIGVLTTYWVMKPVFVPPPQDSIDMVRSSFLHHFRSVADAVTTYAKKENGGVLPEFSSENLPTWWDRYAPAGMLNPDASFYVPPESVGKRMDSLNDSALVMVASGRRLNKFLPRTSVGYEADGFFNFFVR